MLRLILLLKYHHTEQLYHLQASAELQTRSQALLNHTSLLASFVYIQRYPATSLGPQSLYRLKRKLLLSQSCLCGSAATVVGRTWKPMPILSAHFAVTTDVDTVPNLGVRLNLHHFHHRPSVCRTHRNQNPHLMPMHRNTSQVKNQHPWRPWLFRFLLLSLLAPRSLLRWRGNPSATQFRTHRCHMATFGCAANALAPTS